MKKVGLWLCACVVMMLLVSLVLDGCAKPAPTPMTGLPTPAPAESTWQERWDKVLIEAKKEGTVAIYTTGPSRVIADISKPFKEKYGIDLECTAAKGAELYAKIEAQRRGGIYSVDIGLMGLGAYIQASATEETDPVEPLLILPDAKDTSKWFGGRLPLMDKEGHAFALVMSPTSFHIFNTDLVNQGEISSIRDFLNPKWKGKIVMSDPSTTGGANSWYYVVLQTLGMEEGRAYMKELSGNIGAITRDYRQLTEWVARGKYPIGMNARYEENNNFMQLGAPIKYVESNEPRHVTANFALLTVLKDRPHPNGAQLFINWLLSREGLSAFSQISMLPTARTDVSTETISNIYPGLLPRPGDKMATVEGEAEKNKCLLLAKEDFAALLR